MNNKKINELPLFTGDTTGAYFIMNNSGETTTYKVVRETILGNSQTSGTSGTSGVNGTSGTSGTSGSSGSSGSSGTSGTSGSSGSSGTSGTSGSSGLSGSSGTSGESGTSGTSGESGSSGTSGLGFVWQGAWQSIPTTYIGGRDIVSYNGGSYIKIGDGNSGSAPPDDPIRWSPVAEPGTSGSSGSSGSNGADGITPVLGIDYFNGSSGTSGTSGESGSSGTSGESGSSGSSGTSGESGSSGSSGTSGTSGVVTLYLLEAYASETYTLPGGFTEDTCRYSVVSNTVNVSSAWFNTSTYRFTPQKAGYWEIAASYDVYRNSEASLAIKKNADVVAAAGSINAVAQQIRKIVYLNGSTDYINIINVGGESNSRAQFDSRSWFQARWIGE